MCDDKRRAEASRLWDETLLAAERHERAPPRTAGQLFRVFDPVVAELDRLLPCWEHQPKEYDKGKVSIARILEFVGDAAMDLADYRAARTAYRRAIGAMPEAWGDGEVLAKRAALAESVINADYSLLRSRQPAKTQSELFDLLVADYGELVDAGRSSLRRLLKYQQADSKKSAESMADVLKHMLASAGYVYYARAELQRNHSVADLPTTWDAQAQYLDGQTGAWTTELRQLTERRKSTR